MMFVAGTRTDNGFPHALSSITDITSPKECPARLILSQKLQNIIQHIQNDCRWDRTQLCNKHTKQTTEKYFRHLKASLTIHL